MGHQKCLAHLQAICFGRGKDSFPVAADKAITIKRLDLAAENVRELGRLMFDLLQHAGQTSYPPDAIASLDKCHELIRGLPSQADHKLRDPIESKQQPRHAP